MGRNPAGQFCGLVSLISPVVDIFVPLYAETFFYEFSFAIHTKLPHCQSPLRSVAPSRCEKGGSERAEHNDAKVLVRPGTAYGAIRGGSYIFAHSGCCAMALLGASVQECSRFALSGIGNYSLFFCLLQLFCFLYCFLPFTPKQCSNLHQHYTDRYCGVYDANVQLESILEELVW